MPTNIILDSNAKVDRYSRLSASQANMWSACPRMWYYSKVERLVPERPPILFMGTAVEEVICRFLKESPSLITANANINIMNSPLDKEGRPDHENITNWPGINIIPLEEDEKPNSIDELRIWAKKRAEKHFTYCWEKARNEWYKDDNKSGNFDDLDKRFSLEMIYNFIEMHIEEIEDFLKSSHEFDINKWRSGDHLLCNSSPNGFSDNWSGVNQVANDLEQKITICEAWEIVRPWFVDPSAEKFTQTSTIPEHWFQGEYDLVYRWRGKIHIVDIKASKGNNHRSEDYIHQLRYYAWMWWKCHNKSEFVDKLEVWYLGANKKKLIETPTKENIEKIGTKLSYIYEKLFKTPRKIDNYPANPSPISKFEIGGKKIETVDSDNDSRCGICDYKEVCSNSEYKKELPEGGVYSGQGGVEYKLSTTAELKPRRNIIGKIFGLRMKIENGIDVIDEFYLMQGNNMAKVYPLRNKSPKILPNLSNDIIIRIVGGLPVIRRNKLEIQLDDESEIVQFEEELEDDVNLLGFNTTANLHGEIFSFNHWSGPNNRGGITRKFGMTVIDKHGSITVLAWNNSIPDMAYSLRKGDEIVITNAELGEYNGRAQLTLNWNSRINIIHND